MPDTIKIPCIYAQVLRVRREESCAGTPPAIIFVCKSAKRGRAGAIDGCCWRAPTKNDFSNYLLSNVKIAFFIFKMKIFVFPSTTRCLKPQKKLSRRFVFFLVVLSGVCAPFAASSFRPLSSLSSPPVLSPFALSHLSAGGPCSFLLALPSLLTKSPPLSLSLFPRLPRLR